MIVELCDSRPSELTGMRYHELALQQWLHNNFHVVAGYSVPVVFATPMDAFSHFFELWRADNNPFQHLLDAKDTSGTPLYEPYPSPPRYPLFNVYRKGWRYRAWQNFSVHRWKNLSWPTVANAPDREDLGTATVAGMPMAWDYKFQLDFFCLRPDTLAVFVRDFMRKFHRSGGIPQTWLMTSYPFYGRMLTRMYIDGEISNMTPERPSDGSNVEFRASINLTVEGWEPDLNIIELPTAWKLVTRSSTPETATPEQLEVIYSQTTDLRSANSPDLNPNINLKLSDFNPNQSSIPSYSE